MTQSELDRVLYRLEQLRAARESLTNAGEHAMAARIGKTIYQLDQSTRGHQPGARRLWTDGRHFVALTDAGVRLGVGETCFDIPRGHAWFDRIRGIDSTREAVDYMAELAAAFA